MNGGGSIDRFSQFDSRANPGLVILAYGDTKERRIACTCHPAMNVLLSRTEASLISGLKETIFDYDVSGDGTTPNQNPTRLRYRVIEKGATRNRQGAAVSYRYMTSCTYNARGQVTSKDGPLPGTSDLVQFSYAATTGNLLTTTFPSIGAMQLSEYDAAGFPGLKTDVNGRADRFARDARGRLVQTIHLADNSVSRVSYTLSGEVFEKTDEDEAIQGFAYDPTYGRLRTLTDPSGNTVVHACDAQGNLTGKEYSDTTPALTRRMTWSYNHLQYPGHLHRQTLSDGSYCEYDYDEAGNVASYRDFSGNITRWYYDLFNRKTSEIRETASGNVTTQFACDAHGNLSLVTGPEGHTTTYARDDLGRVLVETSAERGVTTYAYDSAGRLESKTDARGVVSTWTYDALSRPVSITAPAYPGRGIEDPLSIVYAYDEGTNQKGLLTSFPDPSGSTTLTYDERGRLQGKTSVVAGVSHHLSRTLSPAGRLTSLAYPSTRTVDYLYASCSCRVQAIHTTLSGRMLTVLDNLGYEPFGGAKAMSFGNGGAVANVENLDGRLLQANVGKPMESTYTYDPDGRLATVSIPATPWFNRQFGYDELGRLISATGPFGVKGYTYLDSGNRHIESRDASLTASGGEVALSFTYNQLNELAKVSLPSGTTVAEYSYNALGQRVAKTVNSTETKGFLYDFDGNLLCETDSAGAITREYIYRGSSRVGFISGGNLYYFHNDTTGNPVLVTDSTKTVVWEGIYEPFGKVTVNSHSTIENNLRFQGQYFDAETGFHYNYHRYYDPRTGTYITPDPIGLAGGINLYAYAGNDPVNGVDPEGLSPIGLIKLALRKVYEEVGGRLPKCNPGKFGSPQRGTPKKGYRLDPSHPDAKPGSPESSPHINWWDYTQGKKGKGGRSGAVSISGSLLPLIGTLLDPFDAISGELASDDEYLRNLDADAQPDQCDISCQD